MSQVYSIKCPKCSAPLGHLGGGRIQSVTCDYCKSVIDLNNNYKILSNFRNILAPDVPFKVGMRGEIDDIEWTVIGWIVYRSKDDAEDKWSEFLLFSPLYGYGWLVYESGDISFSRRVRDFDLRKWKKHNKAQTVFYNKGHYLLEEESYNSIIDFVQGELNWVAKKNDKIRCWDYKGVKGQSLSIEQSRDELEVYHTQKLDSQTIYENFGVEKEHQVIKKQSFGEKIDDEVAEGKPLSFYGIITIFILLLGAIFYNSNIILSETINTPTKRLFRVTNDTFLNQITIKTPSSSTLNSYKITIHQNKIKIFSIDKRSVYFSKQTLGKTWSRSAIGANIYLKLESGQYLLEVTKLDKSITGKLNIKIFQKVLRTSYITPLLILVLLFFIYFYFRRKGKQ